MNVLIVHAHPEPDSFNGTLTRTAAVTLREAGHQVTVSDLYAMGFDPVSDRRNFLTIADTERFKQQAEEAHASQHGGYVASLQIEMDKVAACDLLLFQFPLWWLGMPAILKGWVDKVFAVGRAYGGGKYFDRGVFAGKLAMCSITIGGSADAYSAQGMYGPMETILYPIHHGILGFVGFEVLEPFLAYGPARMSAEQRTRELVRYRNYLQALDAVPARAITEPGEQRAMARKEPLSAAV
ncbi:MAG: NAD(P)H-dependent oxidoreductase [Betaproteobacteria bacterium]|nr:NAD(P)H-dependent oxidoreductase [Betaproteobacteria bacterium]